MEQRDKQSFSALSGNASVPRFLTSFLGRLAICSGPKGFKEDLIREDQVWS